MTGPKWSRRGTDKDSSAKTYHYRGRSADMSLASKISSVLTIMGSVYLSMALAVQESRGFADLRAMSTSPVFVMLFGATAALLMMSWYPSLRVTSEGLEVEVFIFFWAEVPFSEIWDLGVVHLPVLHGGLGPTTYLTVRRLTLIHRLLGFLAFQGPFPVVPIHDGLDGGEELIGEIVEKVKEAWQTGS